MANRHGDLFLGINGTIFMLICDGKKWYYTVVHTEREDFSGSLVPHRSGNKWYSTEPLIGNIQDIIHKATHD